MTDQRVTLDLPESPLRVLLVEDRPAIANAVARGLRAHGHQVCVVHGALEASGQAEAFDVGIFDLSLDDADGVELAQHMARAGQVRGVLFFSGSVEEHVVSRAALTGPVVGKDASLSALHEAVCRVARASAARAQTVSETHPH